MNGGGYFVISIITLYGNNYMAALLVGIIGGYFAINLRELSECSAARVIKTQDIPIITPLIFSTTIHCHLGRPQRL